MDHIETTVDIDAPPDAVWDVLIDVDAYPEWNPVMTIGGTIAAGERVRVRLTPPGKRGATFRPEILVADGRELRWRGQFVVPGLYDGEHSFTLTERADGTTRLVQAETFSGAFVRPINRWLGEATERGFEAMNRALKARVESRRAA